MRRLLITGVVTAATFAAVVIPASASFDPHFAVILDTVQAHRTDDGFRFKEHLFQIDNRSNRVGRDKGGCAERAHRKIKCKVLVHLNGEIGGFGDLRVSGNLLDRATTASTSPAAPATSRASPARSCSRGPRGRTLTFSLVD